MPRSVSCPPIPMRRIHELRRYPPLPPSPVDGVSPPPIRQSYIGIRPVRGNPFLQPMPIGPGRMPMSYCNRCSSSSDEGVYGFVPSCSPDHSTLERHLYMFDENLWTTRVDRNVGFGREIFIPEFKLSVLTRYRAGVPVPAGFEPVTAFIQRRTIDGFPYIESVKVILPIKGFTDLVVSSAQVSSSSCRDYGVIKGYIPEEEPALDPPLPENDPIFSEMARAIPMPEGGFKR